MVASFRVVVMVEWDGGGGMGMVVEWEWWWWNGMWWVVGEDLDGIGGRLAAIDA